MLDTLTRPLKEKLLLPFARGLGNVLSPNGISLISFILGLASAWFIWKGNLKTALIFWALNRITDGLDGTVARLTSRQSDFGGYLDIMLDFFIYALIPLAFVWSDPTQAKWQSLNVMLSLFYVNSASWMYLSALLEKRKAGAKESGESTSVTMPSGIVEGTETIIIFTLLFLRPQNLVLLFYIMSASLFPGIILRLFWARRKLK